MPAPSEIAHRPTWLLSSAHHRARAILTASLAAQGRRGYDVRLLEAMADLGPASQAALGELAGMDRSDVVGTLDRLSTDGLVERSPDPDDRRRNLVSLTDAGRAELVRLRRVLDTVQAEVLAPLTDREAATLVRLLGKLG